jgi:calcium-dependent protein kinase
VLERDELMIGYTEFFKGDQVRANIEVQEIMDTLDFNGNGSIDYSEFMIANIDVTKLIQDDKLQEAFELFDLDHSGTITADEIKKILGNGREIDVDDNEWDRILDEVDADGNGEISFDEFKIMMYKLLSIEIPDNKVDQLNKSGDNQDV